MKSPRNFGLDHRHQDPQIRRQLVGILNMKLAALGQPPCETPDFDDQPLEMARDLIRNFREKNRLLDDYLPPADQRIQAFLDDLPASS